MTPSVAKTFSRNSFDGKIVSDARVNQMHAPYKSGQQKLYQIFDQTHLVLASGKLVLLL